MRHERLGYDPIRDKKIARRAFFASAAASAAIVGGVVLYTVRPASRADWVPDPKLTPGSVVTGVSVSDLCHPGYAAEARAKLKDSTKRLVCKWYKLPYPPVGYRLDHKIAIASGGSPDDPKNLWPQPTTGQWTDKQKDRLEDALHRLICSGKIPVNEAWAAQGLAPSKRTWVDGYKKYVK